MKEKALGIVWAEAQELMPILEEVTLEEAIKKLMVFKDNPWGELEDSIDSALVEYETWELVLYSIGGDQKEAYKTRVEVLIQEADKRGLTPIKVSQLYDLQFGEDSLLTPSKEFIKLKTKLLAMYGYTDKSWSKVLSECRWWSGPKDNDALCNEAMAKLCRKHSVHNPAWTKEYLYAIMAHVAKGQHPSVERVKINGVWHYQLKK